MWINLYERNLCLVLSFSNILRVAETVRYLKLILIFHSILGEQLVNHIPNCQLLTNKMGLLTSLQTYDRVCHSIKGKEPKLKLQDFIPETYRIDDSKEREFFYNTYKSEQIFHVLALTQEKAVNLHFLDQNYTIMFNFVT